MNQTYKESIDGRGRTVIVLEDDLSTALLVCGALGFAPLFLFGWESAPFVLANMMIFGALAAWYRFTRRRIRVMIDPAGRTIAFGNRLRAREVPFGDLQRAQVGAAGNRVELVLRSGEVLPLYAGVGGFRTADCQGLADRINAGLGVNA